MRICFFHVDDATVALSSLPFGDIEIARLAAIKHPRHQKESFAALLALRELTGNESFLILRDENGKPRFDAPSAPHFSLCHASDWAVALLGDDRCGRVGLDMEPLRSYPSAKRVAKRFFSQEELTAFENAGQSEDAFFRLWTKKEAKAKLTGKGLLANKDIFFPSRTFRLSSPEGDLILTLSCEYEADTLLWQSPSKQFQAFQIEEIKA